ncbi:MAG: DUF1385 domain-containing protein [Anaerolineae bacterium]|nr:DUF1385 domain-containing protein [Anaerolineae bacterium]
MAEFSYGGQAIIEGVMMRGSKSVAIAVRDPSGQIVVQREPLNAFIYQGPISKIPVLRGLTSLWDALVLGIRALMRSADVALGEEEGVEFSGPVAWGTMALSLALGAGLFFLLPMFLVSLVDQYISSSLASSAIEGVIRILLFIGYIAAIGLMPDIRRVFAYHGAEHKTINAYEDGATLEPATVAKYSTAHTRCGTGFLLIVLVIYILITAPMGRPPLLIRLASRLITIPIVAGISYELMKFGARHYDNPLVKALVAPGLALQRLTTREPDESMLEVAIASLQSVLAAEE